MRVLQPTDVEDAVSLLSGTNGNVKIVAGGTAMMLMIRNGLIFPEQMVSLEKLKMLDYINITSDEVRIGAMTKLRVLERSTRLAEVLPTLSDALSLVANHRVRRRATMGGNLCEADYASDPPAILVTLGARVLLRSVRGRREILLRDFLVYYFSTAIEYDEVLEEIIIPRPPHGMRSRYIKFVSRTAEDRPCIGVAASVTLDKAGVCQDINVQIAGVTATPFNNITALQECIGEKVSTDLWRHIAGAYSNSLRPIEDVRGTSNYRKKVAGRLIERTLTELTSTDDDKVSVFAPHGAIKL